MDNTNSLKSSIIEENIQQINEIIEKTPKKINLSSLLIYAATKQKYNVILFLLIKGVNVNATNGTGDTALIISADNNNANIIKLLLLYNAKVNIQNNIGYSALFYAALNNNTGAVKMLLNADANPNIQNKNGSTVLISLAKKYDHQTQANSSFTYNPSIVNILLNNGADPTIQDNTGRNALEYYDNPDFMNQIKQYQRNIIRKSMYPPKLNQMTYPGMYPGMYKRDNYLMGGIKSQLTKKKKLNKRRKTRKNII